jgi:signal transduction histidine kinase
MAFEVHPSVIFKLGEDLITDDYQALVELIKNSYDADATFANVKIYTDRYFSVDESSISEVGENIHGALRGMIEIRDNGVGMSVDDIRRGWLTISASRKRELKSRGGMTAAGRTPLGDKGLGRLGTQRLGRILEMQTRQKNHTASNRVVINWSRFAGERTLSDVQISVETIQAGFNDGTNIRIYGINNIEQWKRAKEIQDRFIDIISPYADNMGFNVDIVVDNKVIDLREKSRQVLMNSTITYLLKYEDGVLDVQGNFSGTYLDDLRDREKMAVWNELIGDDNGAAFMDWVIGRNYDKAKSFGIMASNSNKLCEFHFSINPNNIAAIERKQDKTIYDPGGFHGRIDNISRDIAKEDFDNIGEYRNWIDSAKGVRVYRDGFGINLKNDWLKLSAQWTSAKSFYTLRPENVIGYFNISAAGNKCLVEVSNREEFQDNAYYRNLQKILAEWLTRSEEVQSLLRRGYLEYKNIKRLEEADVPVASSPKDVAKDLKNAIRDVVNASDENPLFQTDRSRESIYKLKSKQPAIDILAERLADFEQQFNNTWELVAIGIMAEGITHEVDNILGRLEVQGKAIEKYNHEKYNDDRIFGFADMVRSSAVALRKQISHMDSSLHYIRDVKNEFKVSKLIDSCLSYFETQFEQISIRFIITSRDDFSVIMSQGRLMQVLDNLILNSKYWLMETMNSGVISSGQIDITIQKPFVFVYDNGRGVDTSVEAYLFEPFVTRKPRNIGRGLGLFVSKQLLGLDGAMISLDSGRNKFGNRYRFRVDLSAVVVKE